MCMCKMVAEMILPTWKDPAKTCHLFSQLLLPSPISLYLPCLFSFFSLLILPSMLYLNIFLLPHPATQFSHYYMFRFIRKLLFQTFWKLSICKQSCFSFVRVNCMNQRSTIWVNLDEFSQSGMTLTLLKKPIFIKLQNWIILDKCKYLNS